MKKEDKILYAGGIAGAIASLCCIRTKTVSITDGAYNILKAKKEEAEALVKLLFAYLARRDQLLLLAHYPKKQLMR